MCAKLKRLTFKAIMFALMSLVFYGCSSTATPEVSTAQKAISGIVSDSSGARPYANAEIVAYSANGSAGKAAIPLSTSSTGDIQGKNVQKGTVAKESTTPLSASSSRSDGRGKYTQKIPASNRGAVLLESRQTTESGAPVVYKSVIAADKLDKVAMISPATDMVYQYVVANKGGSFSDENLKKSILAMEQFFGPGFMDIPPLSIGAAPTQAQQQLFIVTKAVSALVSSGKSAAELVATNSSTGVSALGEGSVFTALNAQIKTATAELVKSGSVSETFTMPELKPTKEADVTDVTPPTMPPNLAEVHTTDSVTLTWDASTDDTGVTMYFINRDGLFVSTIAATDKLTFTDKNVEAGTTYNYEVKARDAAGNFSAVSAKSVTTTPIITYTLSGRVATSAGAPMASVYVAITGAGSGVAVTDDSGNYSIPGVRAGVYTVTPSSAGYMFTPPDQEITVAGDVAGVNFTKVDTGTVSGGFAYPPGTIVGGVSFPVEGYVIGGITYPTATVIGGVTYPTGAVIGGITYPNGVIISGVSYPAGTIVGGVAFPVGTPLTAGVTYPTGVIIGGVTYPSGSVNAGITYPSGSVTGVVSYAGGTIFGGVTYPTGTIVGGVAFPNGIAIGRMSYPVGSLSGSIGVVSSNISGRVMLTVGTTLSALSGVDVVLTSGTTVINKTKTIFSGEYIFQNVPFGSYSITASLTGYTLSAPLAVTLPTADKKNKTGADFTATQP